jgi:hypothetical protein
MQSLKSKQVGETLEFKNIFQKTQHIYRDNGKTINIDEVDQLIGSMKANAKKQKKNMAITRIFVVNGDKKASWKDIDEFSEYYNGRVKDVDKFHEFFQVYVTYSTDK